MLPKQWYLCSKIHERATQRIGIILAQTEILSNASKWIIRSLFFSPSAAFLTWSSAVDFTSFSSSSGGLDGMDSMGGGMGSTGGGMVNFKSVSTSTRIVNGKRISTKKYVRPSWERLPNLGNTFMSNISVVLYQQGWRQALRWTICSQGLKIVINVQFNFPTFKKTWQFNVHDLN